MPKKDGVSKNFTPKKDLARAKILLAKKDGARGKNYKIDETRVKTLLAKIGGVRVKFLIPKIDNVKYYSLKYSIIFVPTKLRIKKLREKRKIWKSIM